MKEQVTKIRQLEACRKENIKLRAEIERLKEQISEAKRQIIYGNIGNADDILRYNTDSNPREMKEPGKIHRYDLSTISTVSDSGNWVLYTEYKAKLIEEVEKAIIDCVTKTQPTFGWVADSKQIAKDYTEQLKKEL